MVVGEEICWWQLSDVGDSFGRFRHQHTLSFNKSVEHQHPNDVPKYEILQSTLTICHQHPLVTNIYVAVERRWWNQYVGDSLCCLVFYECTKLILGVTNGVQSGSHSLSRKFDFGVNNKGKQLSRCWDTCSLVGSNVKKGTAQYKKNPQSFIMGLK